MVAAKISLVAVHCSSIISVLTFKNNLSRNNRGSMPCDTFNLFICYKTANILFC